MKTSAIHMSSQPVNFKTPIEEMNKTFKWAKNFNKMNNKSIIQQMCYAEPHIFMIYLEKFKIWWRTFYKNISNIKIWKNQSEIKLEKQALQKLEKTLSQYGI